MTLERETVLAGVAGELRDFAVSVRSLDDVALDAPTRCAAWTVHDVAAHVVGIVVDVVAGNLEGQGTHPVTERQAQERKGATSAELADELDSALPALASLLESLPPDVWEGPSLLDPAFTFGFAVEALWYDAYIHADDIRTALGIPPARGAGLHCAVHHVAGYLDQRGSSAMTLLLDGLEPVHVNGGGPQVSGDPLEFVLAATGRVDAAELGLDSTINVYRDI